MFFTECDDAGNPPSPIYAADEPVQNSSPVKISNMENNKNLEELNTELTVNKPETLALNSNNNCDDVSTTSGDSDNKLLIMSDGGAEEINQKQIQISSEEKLLAIKSQSLEKSKETKSVSSKKDKKGISLEDIGIKVRHFKGHLSSLGLPKTNKDAEETNTWKLETYKELHTNNEKEKVEKENKQEISEKQIENEMNGGMKTVNATNKDFLSSYRIPKIKRDNELCRDSLNKSKTCDKSPEKGKQEKLKEDCKKSENKNKDKLSNNKIDDPKGIDSRRLDFGKTKTECDKEDKFEEKNKRTGKRKLFNHEIYKQEKDKLENIIDNNQTPDASAINNDDCQVIENESPCYTGKSIKLRRKSLNLPRRIIVNSSDDDELVAKEQLKTKSKHLEYVGDEKSAERNVKQPKRRASLHIRILDSSCDEDEEAVVSETKEQQINKSNSSIKQRRKSMFVESSNFNCFEEEDKPSSKKLCPKKLNKALNDNKINSKNVQLLKTPVKPVESSTVASMEDNKGTGKTDLTNKTSKHLQERRKSLSTEPCKAKETKPSDVLQDDKTTDLKSPETSNDLSKAQTNKNSIDKNEVKRKKYLKMRRKSPFVESASANNVGNNESNAKQSLKMCQTSMVVETRYAKEDGIDEIIADCGKYEEIKTKLERKDLENENVKEPVYKETEIDAVVNKQPQKDLEELNSPKPRRQSINHRRILDSSSDDNGPLIKKPLLTQNEIKPPVPATEPKTKSRKRRAVKVLSTSMDSINTSANSSLQSEILAQIHSNSPSPFASPLFNHPIFHREVSTQSREFVASMPVTPNQQDDKKLKEIDSELYQIFQSPQYTEDYKTNHNNTTDSINVDMLSSFLPHAESKNVTIEDTLDSKRERNESLKNISTKTVDSIEEEVLSTSLPDSQSVNITVDETQLGNNPENEESLENVSTKTADFTKREMLSTSLPDYQSMNISLEETQLDISRENDQSPVNTVINYSSNANLNNTIASHNCSEIKHLSLGSAEYRFEKVSDNVVNLFISRKRKRKRQN